MSSRIRMSSKLRERILREFNYLCAVCGRPCAQVHHIDHDPSNNAEMNLLPLCPNHHLIDAHSPTDQVPPLKMALFRKHRDPYIWLSQFAPLFKRMHFLLEPDSAASFNEVHRQARDLVAFVSSLKMGDYYSSKLNAVLDPKPPYRVAAYDLSDTKNAAAQEQLDRVTDERFRANYISRVAEQADELTALIIECLRFQEWKAIPRYGDA
jgi:hypothetical protein